MNMLATIVPKSDQLNADDLIGRTMTITVTDVKMKIGDDQPVALHYEGDGGKPYKPCKSMRRVLVQIWGADAKGYAGRSMTLYRDPTVTFGKDQVGGIRISHMSHIDKAVTMALTATRANRKPFTVQPLQAQQLKPEADPRADAIRWVESYEAQVRAANEAEDSLTAFEALDAKHARALPRLETAFPDLFKRATDFRNGTGAGAHQPEGRPDLDYGDQHDGDGFSGGEG